MRNALLLLFLIPVLTHAQEVTRNGLAQVLTAVPMQNFPLSTSRVAFDTLYSNYVKNLIFETPIAGCDEVIVYSDGADGYAVGTNQFGDLEKMQKFKATNIIGVYQTLAVFADKVQSNPNTPVYSNIYNVDPVTHGPGEFVFVSDPTPMSDIWGNLANPSFSGFQFPFTIPVYDSFFVSFTIPQGTGDKIVCAATPNSCYPGYQIAWERRADSTFKPFNDGTNGTWGLNIELFICPVVEIGSLEGIPQPASMNGITHYAAYPNPAVNSFKIKFGIDEPGDVSLLLYDLSGKKIVEKSIGKLQKGVYENELSLQGIPKGLYNYAIRCNDRYFFSRITVQ